MKIEKRVYEQKTQMNHDKEKEALRKWNEDRRIGREKIIQRERVRYGVFPDYIKVMVWTHHGYDDNYH